MKEPTDLVDRDFSYHKPDEAVGKTIGVIRDVFKEAARNVLASIPPGREAAMVKTKLEEAMFWASAALARPAAK